MSTTKMTKRPSTVMDATPKDADEDEDLCQCEDVQRRWDGDGIVERDSDGVTWYRCSVCGKKYSV